MIYSFQAVRCDSCGSTRQSLNCGHNPDTGGYTCDLCRGVADHFTCDVCRSAIFNPKEILYIQSAGSYMCNWCNPTHPNFHLNGKGYPKEEIYKPLESFLRLLI